MAGSRVKIKLEGFDELLKKIESSGGTIKSAVDTCMKKSAKIMEDSLKTEMKKANVPSDLINRMDAPKVKWEYNACTASVGYEKGTYNPDNLSDGYKVVFLNYGTPHRSVHGKVKARGFIGRSKKKAKSQIKKSQEETLQDILKELQ